MVFLISMLGAQEEENKGYLKEHMELNGYMKYMNTLFIPEGDSLLLTDNLLHNRLNYTWYLSNKLTFKAGMRNRFLWGEFVRTNKSFNPFYMDAFEQDPGFLNLSFLWGNESSYIGHTIFDRMNLLYSTEKLEVTVGRQRINWGTSFIWNPNDIFNAYSFFDFDYEERPGTDAALVRYYPNYTSNIDLVYAPGDNLQAGTYSGLYKFNKWGYDLQFIGGYQKRYFVLGGGWAGDIKGAGFRGEFTYFIPENSFTLAKEQFVGGLDIDYTFKNAFYIHAAYLFNSLGINQKSYNYQGFFFNRNLSAQNLSPSMHSLFAEVRYPVSPITNIAFYGMTNPTDGSFFVGPSFSYSVSSNFGILLNGQLYLGKPNTAYGGYGSAYYLRFKFSF